MICSVCGKRIERNPVWVMLGDKGDRTAQEAFPLHAKCYPKAGKVTVREPAYTDDEGVLQEGKEFETQRYVKVKAP